MTSRIESGNNPWMRGTQKHLQLRPCPTPSELEPSRNNLAGSREGFLFLEESMTDSVAFCRCGLVTENVSGVKICVGCGMSERDCDCE